MDVAAGTRTVRVPAGALSGALLAPDGDAPWALDAAGSLAPSAARFWRLNEPGVGVQLANALTISEHFAWQLGLPPLHPAFPPGELVVATDDGLVVVEAGAPR